MSLCCMAGCGSRADLRRCSRGSGSWDWIDPAGPDTPEVEASTRQRVCLSRLMSIALMWVTLWDLNQLAVL